MNIETKYLKIIFGLSLIILVFSIYIYFKPTSFYTAVHPNDTINRIEQFKITDIEDPLFMFNWFFDICETSYNPQLNNNAP